jgi:hypothetical protein
MPRLCEFYPGICLTTEEKARKTLRQGKKNLSQVKKNLTNIKVYMLPKHQHIIKLTQTHTSMLNVTISSPAELYLMFRGTIILHH